MLSRAVHNDLGCALVCQWAVDRNDFLSRCEPSILDFHGLLLFQGSRMCLLWSLHFYLQDVSLIVCIRENIGKREEVELV